MAQSAKGLPWRDEDPSSDLQHPNKAWLGDMCVSVIPELGK